MITAVKVDGSIYVFFTDKDDQEQFIIECREVFKNKLNQSEHLFYQIDKNGSVEKYKYEDISEKISIYRGPIDDVDFQTRFSSKWYLDHRKIFKSFGIGDVHFQLKCAPIKQMADPFKMVFKIAKGLADYQHDHHEFKDYLKSDNPHFKDGFSVFHSGGSQPTILIIPMLTDQHENYVGYDQLYDDNENPKSTQVSEIKDYRDIASFTKNAPLKQIKAIWNFTLKMMEQIIKNNNTIKINMGRDKEIKDVMFPNGIFLGTHGYGASHMHIRLNGNALRGYYGQSEKKLLDINE